jgi:methionyl-tRNA formyltransferase
VAVAAQQDDQQSTYAQKIDKSEALIDWSQSAATVARKIRAFNPFPATYTRLEGSRIKVWVAQVEGQVATDSPGTIVNANADGLLVQCAGSQLLITEIQLAGKSRMPVSEILKSRAQLFAPGKRFD